jgi:hypothetical protein
MVFVPSLYNAPCGGPDSRLHPVLLAAIISHLKGGGQVFGEEGVQTGRYSA